VVIGGTIFQETTIRRDPESVALTSPNNATGLFEMQQESHMMLPFESSGVDMVWELRMPKASNPFDFNTIVDVLITIEYTALDSYDYRQQVINELDRNVNANQAFSLKNHFPDQWYALHNPEDGIDQISVKFDIKRDFFPPNIQNLIIQHVQLYISTKDGKQIDNKVTIHLIDQINGMEYGGSTTPINNVISTRSGNVAGCSSLIGKKPEGTWQLSLEDYPEAMNMIRNNEIEDILLIITYSGEMLEWPDE